MMSFWQKVHMVLNEWELDCKNPPVVVMEKLLQSPAEMWVALAIFHMLFVQVHVKRL